jgi:hypothetical protein
VDWLVTSIVLSVVLTVVLNVALRAFPGARDRAFTPPDETRRVRVWAPWRGMLVASIALTILLNLALWLL